MILASTPPHYRLATWMGREVGVFATEEDATQAGIYWTASRVTEVARAHEENPILVAFREYACLEVFGYTSELIVGQVLADLAGLPIEYEGKAQMDLAIRHSHLSHLIHARRVLTRLYTLIGTTS